MKKWQVILFDLMLLCGLSLVATAVFLINTIAGIMATGIILIILAIFFVKSIDNK